MFDPAASSSSDPPADAEMSAMDSALASALEFEPLSLEAIDDEHQGADDLDGHHGLNGERVSPPPTLEEILEDTDYLDGTRDGDEDADDFGEDSVRFGSSVYSSSTTSSAAMPMPMPMPMAVPTSLLDTLSLHSKGSGDSRSLTSSKSSRSRRAAAARARANKSKGSIMRHVILKGVSSQLVSASERANAGIPTVMTTTDVYIAVGTSHGLVLVFDGQQALKFSLGGVGANENGAVSSMSFNPESTRVLVGFAKGQISEFDLTSGKLTMTLADVHPLGSAVVHTRFTDDPSIALMADSGGSVYEITFRRMLGGVGGRGYASRCIFSGSRGEACALEPLSLVAYPDHKLGSSIIVTLATISKVIVLSLRPAMKVLFTQALVGKSDTLPILSWQFVIIQTTSSEKVVDPVIAFGRQSSIYFYQLTENLGGKTVFVPLQKLELSYDILNFGWLNTRCLAILDTTEGFHLHDVRNQEDLESLDLSEVGLVYGSSFFKGLATGGNVSRAMTVAGERATYGSFMTFTNQLLLLGRQSFHILVIRTWNERLDHLTKDNRYLDALALGCEFYKDQGKTLVGLKGPREKRKTVIAQKLLAILLKFLDVSMNANFPLEGNMAVLSDYFDEVVPPCVKTCIVLRRKDVLFENVWNTYNLDPFAKAKFLESLEVHILSDQLKTINPKITQELVSHLETVSRFDALEACVTHIGVASLDIHQVISVCWLNGLYDAIIYVYNNGMLDYVTPAEELLSVLTGAMSSTEDNKAGLTQRQTDLGNKILVYISCCLAGRAYPYGEIPKDRLAKVKYEVYNCLTALHTKKHKDDELTYPYLRTLLKFDTQGLLNVVAIAFEEPEFNTDVGLCQKQRLVDILEKVICEGEGYTPTQLGYLFTFIARQIAKGDKVFQVSRDLFDKFLDVLTTSTSADLSSSHHEERQQALLELIDAGGLKYFDREKLIFRSESVGFFRILETLHEDAKEYDKVVECILKDAPRKRQAFAFVQKVLLEDAYDDEAKQLVEKVFMKYLIELADEVDVKKTAMIIYYHMSSYIPLVIAKLEDKRESLYHYLRHTMAYREIADGGGSKAAADSTQIRKAEQEIDNAFEMFVDLMCEFEPKKVASFLKSRHASHDVHLLLKICRRRDSTEDAVAYLLESDGKVKEAFELLKGHLDTKLVQVTDLAGDAVDEETAALFWSQVNASVVILVQLCQRSSATSLSEEEKKSLWFSLLDCLLIPQRSMEEPVPALKEVVKHVVNSAIGYIPLRSVLEKILQDPVYQAGRFGDIKEFLVEMMEMYHYEETLLRSTMQLVRDDLHGQLLKRQAAARRGIACRDLNCDQCSEHVALCGGRCIVFQCGHKYHMSCLAMAGCAVISDLGEETWHCYKCVTKNNRGTDKLTRESESAAAPPGAAGDRPPVSLGDKELSDITDQKMVVAKAYLDKFKAAKPPMEVMKDMAAAATATKREHFHVEGAEGNESEMSIFDRADFPLKMWSNND